MTSILGENVSLIRPRNIKPRRIQKEDYPTASYNTAPRTIKEHSGRVKSVCIKLKNGAIRAMKPGYTHPDVCKLMAVDFDNVIATGWELENGNST